MLSTSRTRGQVRYAETHDGLHSILRQLAITADRIRHAKKSGRDGRGELRELGFLLGPHKCSSHDHRPTIDHKTSRPASTVHRTARAISDFPARAS